MLARESVPARHHGQRHQSDSDKVTSDWIDRVQLEIKERGWGYREFASQIVDKFKVDGRITVKCSSAGIGKVLKKRPDGSPATKHSTLVPAICTLLNIPPGVVDNPQLTKDTDPREAEILSAFRKLPRAEQDTFHADVLARAKRS